MEAALLQGPILTVRLVRSKLRTAQWLRSEDAWCRTAISLSLASTRNSKRQDESCCFGSTVISSEDVNNEIADLLKPVAWLAAGMRAQGMLGCVLSIKSWLCE